jgi:hypothetical protein
MGSCFSDNMGTLLEEYKFYTLPNPFGTIYDPLSIARLLNYALNNTLPHKNSYVESQGLFANLHTHSKFSGLSQAEVELKLKGTTTSVHNFLKQTDWLILTFGTAWVYQYKATGELVANCHKLPTAKFKKSLCSLAQLTDSYSDLIAELTVQNPEIKIVVTVSPVRHLNDTLPGNSLSKALLRLFSHELEKTYSNVYYYPSYEILIDDLRDYRFYKEDMIHPSEQAVSYIWEHFMSSFADETVLDFLAQWQKIKQSLTHKPFHPQSAQHQNFLRRLLNQIRAMEEVVDVSKEIKIVEQQLSDN